MAPDPTFAFVGGPCCPTLDFVCVFWTMITFNILLLCHFFYCNVSKSFNDKPAKFERLKYRNSREIEVLIYLDSFVIVRKNDVFGKGGAESSDKILCRYRKNTHRDP